MGLLDWLVIARPTWDFEEPLRRERELESLFNYRKDRSVAQVIIVMNLKNSLLSVI